MSDELVGAKEWYLKGWHEGYLHGLNFAKDKIFEQANRVILEEVNRVVNKKSESK